MRDQAAKRRVHQASLPAEIPPDQLLQAAVDTVLSREQPEGQRPHSCSDSAAACRLGAQRHLAARTDRSAAAAPAPESTARDLCLGFRFTESVVRMRGNKGGEDKDLKGTNNVSFQFLGSSKKIMDSFVRHAPEC